MSDVISDVLSREEREVVLTISDCDDEWHAYVSSPKMMKKFESAGWKCVSIDHDSEGRAIAKCYVGPRERITISKERKKRELTDEQIFELRKRAKLMSENKRKKQ